MNQRLLQIIQEELEDFYDYDQEQNMADKYFQTHAAPPPANPKINTDAQVIGYVTRTHLGYISVPIPIYKNPKDIKDFGMNARGVLLPNGDFYLASSSVAMHDFILPMLSEKGIIPYGKVYDYDNNYPEEFVAVQRMGTTNEFTQSSTYHEFPEYYKEMFDTANKVQPFKFTYYPFDESLDEMESPLDPNFQISYFPQGYDAGIVNEIAKKIGYKP
jgi:hypothetical protein